MNVTYGQIKQLAAYLAGRADDTTGLNLKLSVSEAAMLRAFFAEELRNVWLREAWPETCDHITATELDANKCFVKAAGFTVSGAGTSAVNGDYRLDPDGNYYQTGDRSYYIAGVGTDWTIRGPAALPEGGSDLYTLSGSTTGLGAYTNNDAEDPAPTVTALDEMGEVLSVWQGGDPRTTTAVNHVVSFADLGDRVNVVSNDATVYVEYQEIPPDLLDADVVGADVDEYELPARFKLPLALRGAALLIADEDPAKAGALRQLAERDLNEQASRLRVPWWRGR